MKFDPRYFPVFCQHVALRCSEFPKLITINCNYERTVIMKDLVIKIVQIAIESCDKTFESF